MKWKTFLKPDWRKIMLTVVLILITIFGESLLPFYIPFSIFSAGKKTSISSLILLWPVALFCPPIQPPPEGVVYTIFCPLLFFGLIAVIFYQYLLSCLLVWIYDKVKKK